jgi:hypothetical protein
MEIFDNGGRRSSIERRKSGRPIELPDRRSNSDRRSGFDRRGGLVRKGPKAFREKVGMSRSWWFKKKR